MGGPIAVVGVDQCTGLGQFAGQGYSLVRGDTAGERARKLVQKMGPEEFKIGESVIRIQIGERGPSDLGRFRTDD